MKTRAALIVAAVAGLASVASAQPTLPNATVTYSLSYINTATGTVAPLAPGQSAQITLNVAMNPAPGSAGTWGTVVSPGGSGTYRGIQAIFNDLVGTGGAEGTWNVNQATGLGVTELWDVTGGAGNGSSALAGARLTNVQAGQFPASQASVNTTNPINAIWTGIWTPSSYTARTVTWSVALGSANPSTQANALIVRDPTLNSTVFIGTGVDSFGSVGIQIIPGPSSLALLGMGGLLAARRRR